MSESTKPRRTGHFVVILDSDDRRALDAIAAAEKLTRADCVRRLIRARARLLTNQDVNARRAVGE